MIFKHKPLIGVTTASFNGSFMYFWIWFNITCSGGKVLRIDPLKPDGYESCVGFVISGGADINPELYNQKNKSSVNIDHPRDELEKKIIQHALDFHKPLMGICRGAQMINIVKGGTLHQNVGDEYPDFVPTNSLLAKAFLKRYVSIFKGSFLSKLFKPKGKVLVNSIHHQSIAKTGENIKVSAKDDLGIVQAIESTQKSNSFILGVQWHPELLVFSRENRQLFRKLIEVTQEKL